jgi:hypothetical protein
MYIKFYDIVLNTKGWFNDIVRLTGLGEFSPIGSLFPLRSYLKITEVANIFWAPLFNGWFRVLISTKHGLGYI